MKVLFCIMCLNFVMPGPGPSQQKDPQSVLASLVCLTVQRQGGQRWTIAWEMFVMERPKWRFARKLDFLLGVPGKDFIGSDNCSHLLEADICLEGRRLLRLASDVLLDLDIMRSECE